MRSCHSYARSVFVALLLLPVSLACSSAAGKKPKPPDPTASASTGIYYYLPQTQLQIDAKRELKQQNAVNADGSGLESKKNLEVVGDVKAVTVPDGQARSLDLSPRALVDGSLTVSVSADGYLEGINSTATGRAGDLVTNVFQIVGRVLALGTGFGFFAGAAVFPQGQQEPPAITCTSDGLSSTQASDDFLNRTTPDPSAFDDKTTYYFVTHSNLGCSIWKDVVTSQATVRMRHHELRVQEAAKVGAAGRYDSAEARRVEEAIAQAERLLRRAEASLTNAQARYAAELKKFAKAQGMIPTDVVPSVERHETFSLAEVPHYVFSGKVSKPALQAALASSPRMRTLADAGFVVTRLDAAPSDTSSTAAQNCPSETIAYREPRPIRLALYQETEPDSFEKSQERTVTSFEGAQRCVPIQTSSWAGRALAMEFAAFGVPKKLQRTNSAALVAATSSFATGLTNLQNTYAESLEKVLAIQKSQREIDQNDLVASIEKAKKEKDLFDAQLALEGANASRDLVLQQQLAAKELALLQQQLELRKSEAGIESQLELAALKDRLALLEQQVAIVVAEKKLAEARKP